MKYFKSIAFLVVGIVLLAYTLHDSNKTNRVDTGYYQEQIQVITQTLKKDPKDAIAWENYYLTLQHAYLYGPLKNRPDWDLSEREALKEMEKNVPNSVEFYRCKVRYLEQTGKKTDSDQEIISLIKTGLNIEPTDRILIGNLIGQYELEGQSVDMRPYYTRLYNSQVATYTVMEYNYNVLMSVEPGAILFTHADADSYPILMLQEVKGIRPDISLVTISSARSKNYLKRMLHKKNIELPESVFNESSKNDLNFIKQVILAIHAHYPQVPVYVAMTCPVQGFLEDSLYCTGLAYKFSTRPINSITYLKQNLENSFHLDYLNNCLLPSDSANTELKNLNFNYTVPFAILYRHMQRSKDTSNHMRFYKDYCLKNAETKGKKAEMENYLDEK